MPDEGVRLEFTASTACINSSRSALTNLVPNASQLRAAALGLLVGCLLCFTNLYFGLQTGWISMLVKLCCGRPKHPLN